MTQNDDNRQGGSKRDQGGQRGGQVGQTGRHPQQPATQPGRKAPDGDVTRRGRDEKPGDRR